MIREWLFSRRHRKACAATLASEAARELALIGAAQRAERRRRTVREMAQEMRRQMNLPEDPRLA